MNWINVKGKLPIFGAFLGKLSTGELSQVFFNGEHFVDYKNGKPLDIIAWTPFLFRA